MNVRLSHHDYTNHHHHHQQQRHGKNDENADTVKCVVAVDQTEKANEMQCIHSTDTSYDRTRK